MLVIAREEFPLSFPDLLIYFNMQLEILNQSKEAGIIYSEEVLCFLRTFVRVFKILFQKMVHISTELFTKLFFPIIKNLEEIWKYLSHFLATIDHATPHWNIVFVIRKYFERGLLYSLFGTTKKLTKEYVN